MTAITEGTWVFGRTYIDGAYRVGVGQVGRKWVQVVYLKDGNFATVEKMPNDAYTARSFKPLHGYPTARSLATVLLRGRKVSQMSKAAREVLTRAKAS